MQTDSLRTLRIIPSATISIHISNSTEACNTLGQQGRSQHRPSPLRTASAIVRDQRSPSGPDPVTWAEGKNRQVPGAGESDSRGQSNASATVLGATRGPGRSVMRPQTCPEERGAPRSPPVFASFPGHDASRKEARSPLEAIRMLAEKNGAGSGTVAARKPTLAS